jgi:hypothetical protein
MMQRGFLKIRVCFGWACLNNFDGFGAYLANPRPREWGIDVFPGLMLGYIYET